MKQKWLWLVVLLNLCSVGAAFSFEVIQAPDTTGPLAARIQWGTKQAEAAPARQPVLVGYSIERFAYPNEFVGSFHTDRPETESLVEILTGRKIVNPLSRHHKEQQPRVKIPKETAILLKFQSGGGTQVPVGVNITDMELPFRTEAKRLVWVGHAAVAESVRFLRGIYSSGTVGLKEDVIPAIGVHQNGDLVIPVLQEILQKEKSSELRGEAAFWLAQQKDPRALQAVVKFVEAETNEDVFEKALAGLHSSESPDAEKLLRKWTGKGYRKELRDQAIFWLGQYSDSAENAALLHNIVFEDQDPEIQERAIFSLSQMKQELFVPRLVEIAQKHPGREARKHAIFWLAQEASKKARGFIANVASNDRDTEVQKHAVFALYELNDNEGVPELIKIAKSHPNPEVRKQAIFWLGESGDERAVDALLEIVKD